MKVSQLEMTKHQIQMQILSDRIKQRQGNLKLSVESMYICMSECIQMRGTLCMDLRVSVNVSSSSFEKSKCVFVRVVMPKNFRG